MSAIALLFGCLGAALVGLGCLLGGKGGKAAIVVGTASAGAATVLAAVAVA